MTVQELIDKLMKIENKDMPVEVPTFHDYFEDCIEVHLSLDKKRIIIS